MKQIYAKKTFTECNNTLFKPTSTSVPTELGALSFRVTPIKLLQNIKKKVTNESIQANIK